MTAFISADQPVAGPTPVAAGAGAVPGRSTARTVLPAAANGGNMVALTDRIRFMQLVRVAGGMLALIVGMTLPAAAGQQGALAVATLCYLAIAGVAELFWRARSERGLTLFGVLLLVDGVYLAWVSHLTGGMGSDLRFLVVVYAVATTLLASYRTGMKSSLWSSITLYVVYRADDAGWLEQPAELTSGQARTGLISVVALLLVVAFATAVFSAVNEREARRARYDLQALTRMARQLEGETRPDLVAATVLAALKDTFRLRRVVLVGVVERELRVLAADPQTATAVAGDCPLLSSFAAGTDPLLLARLDPATAGPLAVLLPGATNVVVLPLHDEDGFTGAVVCERGAGDGARLDRRALAMMQQFTAHAALALRRAHLLDELLRRAETDGLTGVANRRTFDETLTRELARAARTGTHLGLLLIDVDNFKAVNDAHGHQVGDLILRELGRLLADHARPFDTPARYGGEEFAVILPACEPAEAVTVAERLRGVIAHAPTSVPITVSIGVASHPTNPGTAGELIRAADTALYTAKRQGRNRVCAAGNPTVAAAVHHA